MRDNLSSTVHITRMFPKRYEEVLQGGSLYCVIKSKLCVRQKILNIERFIDGYGVKRCKIELNESLVLTVPHKERPFQGWRYLETKDSPQDIKVFDIFDDNNDQEMVSDLHNLGLV